MQGICGRYDTAQNELEISDDTDQFGDQQLCENHYYDYKANFSELLHPVINTIRSRNFSLRKMGQETPSKIRDHINVANI